MRRMTQFFAAAAALASFVLSAAEPPVKPLLSEGQKKFISMEIPDRVTYFADAAKRKEMQALGYYPLHVTLPVLWKSNIVTNVTVQEDGADASAVKTDLHTIEKTSVTAPVYITVTFTKNGQIELGNLKIGTKYTWTSGSETGEFVTENITPRLVRINGVPNVRDLGGYIGLNGKRVRQGLVYRTAGLNDNAKTTYAYSDKALDGKPELQAVKAWRELVIADCKNGLKGNNVAKSLLKYDLNEKWTVFVPKAKKFTDADYRAIANLTEIPAEFMGVPGKEISTDRNGLFVFPDPYAYAPSLFVKTFNAPEAGFLAVGCGADWFFRIYVNGELCYDLIQNGNTAFPINLNNNAVVIPVQKGKNIIAIPLLSGSASWTFCFGKADSRYSYADLLKARIAVEEREIKIMTKVESGFEPGKNRLDSAAQSYVVNGLGIRSDIDLRSDAECRGMTGSPAGKEVKWFHISSKAYKSMQREEGKAAFKEVFKVFLDEKNYPIVFHCIAGQDRTGAVAFIINGLLGVDLNHLYLDWEVTGFWNPNPDFCHKKRFNKLLEGFNEWPGKTMNEKIENYVLSLGFTKADIEKLRSIMLEK